MNPSEFINTVTEKNASWITSVAEAFGETTAIVPRESIVDVCRSLRDEHSFDLLADVCGGDRGPEEDPRFEVNYHLFSTTHYQRLRLKVLLSEDDAKVDSVTDVWRTADWHERETFDLL